ncbi:nitrogen fixation protein NifQ [Marinospirillum alkaliphilum]|uniref:Nitrogen fixation protein NifQ n=1 Tax=Marinospirillum alkaliphilum DSM 21637 TaxID=1122209 RepID=A0A1K1TAZ9_9GAMM|nr:nitrogen fixation protein NifQ [Marinospirillum alkaliphilum]SFW97690.1 nitrogen fixation protein NifQ [Marinospirillum alkaliphilum DSM 21637]
MNAQVQPPRIRSLYSYWVGCSDGDINAIYLARMLASQAEGHSVLGCCLGLSPDAFQSLLQRYFPRCFPMAEDWLPAQDEPVHDFPEQDSLTRLLLSFRAARDESETWIANILASGCAGQEHLWYDLGLWSRMDLQTLLAHNFPELVRRNHLDMKWKKFLYRQLCMDTGLTYCRSPSCDACPDYKECFAPE